MEECEEKLKDEGWGWGILDPQGQSYMRAIRERRKLLLGARWSQLDAESERQLKGSYYRRKDLEWWGLMGRMGRKNWPAVRRNEPRVRASLDAVRRAPDDAFPDIAVGAVREMTDIDYVGHGTATLLLALARPDRCLSLNGASEKGLGALASMGYSTLRKPEKYGELLRRWLYRQPWYVDPFVYEPT